ncbi:hypothetical protein DSL92_06090 [Billgrantia gudaonensis]|uniref:Uncharacterized protein n=1 Tax=Billgrantia gudaonensis TaxID=376427 RepID=A0A3S0NDW8_9GAMM|nr:hypothetical protein DSL92_06090 [Halomonas gudaonensis]
MANQPGYPAQPAPAPGAGIWRDVWWERSAGGIRPTAPVAIPGADGWACSRRAGSGGVEVQHLRPARAPATRKPQRGAVRRYRTTRHQPHPGWAGQPSSDRAYWAGDDSRWERTHANLALFETPTLDARKLRWQW